MDEESPGFSEWVSRTAKRATDALASGRWIVIMEDDKVIKLWPDGTKEILKVIV